jgi:hypothetical protein
MISSDPSRGNTGRIFCVLVRVSGGKKTRRLQTRSAQARGSSERVSVRVMAAWIFGACGVAEGWASR